MRYLVKTGWPIALIAALPSVIWFFVSAAHSNAASNFGQTYFEPYAAATIAILALAVNLTLVFLTYQVYQTALNAVELAAEATKAAGDSAATTRKQLAEDAHYKALEWLPMLDLDLSSICILPGDDLVGVSRPSFEHFAVKFEVHNKGKGPAVDLRLATAQLLWKNVRMDAVVSEIVMELVCVSTPDEDVSRPFQLLQGGEKKEYSEFIGLDLCSAKASTVAISRSDWDKMKESVGVALQHKGTPKGWLPGIDLKFSCHPLQREGGKQKSTATWRILFSADEESKWRVWSSQLVEFSIPLANDSRRLNTEFRELAGLQSEDIVAKQLLKLIDWLSAPAGANMSFTWPISYASKERLVCSIGSREYDHVLSEYIDPLFLTMLPTSRKRELVSCILKSGSIDGSL